MKINITRRINETWLKCGGYSLNLHSALGITSKKIRGWIFRWEKEEKEKKKKKSHRIDELNLSQLKVGISYVFFFSFCKILESKMIMNKRLIFFFFFFLRNANTFESSNSWESLCGDTHDAKNIHETNSRIYSRIYSLRISLRF